MSQEYEEDGNDVDSDRENDESEEEELNIRRSKPKAESVSSSKLQVTRLIEYFGRLVQWEPQEGAIPDNRGKYREEDKIYSKLIKSTKTVILILNLLKENEDFDKRPLTLLVHRQKWVSMTLRPLMELCQHEDSITALRCCKLAICLTRPLTKEVYDVLNVVKKPRKSAEILDKEEVEKPEEETLHEEEEDNEKEIKGKGKGTKKLSVEEITQKQNMLRNAKEQLSALLSFKEAFCTEKCVMSIINIFQEAWWKESLIPLEIRNKNVDKEKASKYKTDIGVCIAFFRQLLRIEAHPIHSSSAEIMNARKIQNLYLVYLRPLLPIIVAICASIENHYYDLWLIDYIQLLHTMIKEYEAKDLYRVWRENALIPAADLNQEAEILDVDTDNIAVEKRPLPNIVVPQKALPKRVDISISSSTKALSLSLKQERNQRLSNTVDSRTSRFKSTYVKVPILGVRKSTIQNDLEPTKDGRSALPPELLDEDPSKLSSDFVPEKVTQVKSGLQILRHLPSQEVHLNQMNKKRNKKHLTFVAENPVVKETQSKNLSTDEGQKALIVVATLMDMLTGYDEDDDRGIPCIRQFIRRINEDRRRNDLMIGDEIEIYYFEILSKALHYNRLKLQDLKRRHDQDIEERRLIRLHEDEDFNVRWEPQVKNIINALDLMSLNRAVTCIERMRERKDIKNLCVPVELYKEQISNLRILFESDNISHNEIAIAGAGRIFYRTDQRLDQLPKLLAAFKPGIHEKQYLCVLVELVHETMKTLEAATMRCNSIIDEEEKRRLTGNKKVKRSEESYENYLSLCIGFDVKEYFKRLVTNNTILLYIKLLKEYKSLDPVVLHYIHCFLHRVCTFKLEQKYPTPIAQSTVELEDCGLTLMYMLFNWQSMSVFNEILQDPRIDSVSHMAPLVRLVKSVVRQLGFALQKNHMLFVDMLFLHTNPHAFCESLDNIYEVTTWKSAFKNSDENKTESSKKSKIDDQRPLNTETFDEDTDHESPEKNDGTAMMPSSSKFDGSLEEEFDDNFDFALPKVSQTSKKSMRGRRNRSNDSEDGDSDGERVRPEKKKRSTWSKEEDKIIRQLYPLYSGTRSVYTIIAEDENLRSLGNDRTAKQVEKRVRRLKLDETSESFEAVKENEHSPNYHASIISPGPTDNNIDSDAGSLDSLTLSSKKMVAPVSAMSNKQSATLASIFSPDSSEDNSGVSVSVRSPNFDLTQRVKPVKEGKLVKKAKLSMDSARTSRDSDDDEMFEENDIKASKPNTLSGYARRMQIDSDDE